MAVADIGSHPHRPMTRDLDDTAEFFVGVRQLLFGVAYRMLGGVADAEDVVQDAWLRWQCCDRHAVQNPTAFLVTTTTRLCINELHSARRRRETQLGPWLTEPVDTDADPALGAEHREALRSATRILLEKLSPAERAAYVLREAFDYPHRRIAAILGVTEPNARQLVSRARRHLVGGRREPSSPAAHRRLFAVFVDAAQHGQMTALEQLLAAGEIGEMATVA